MSTHFAHARALSERDATELAVLLGSLSEKEWPDDIDAARAHYDSWGAPVPADVDVRRETFGGVPTHVHTPPEVDDSRIGVYLHGGGYVYGSQRSHGALVAEIARAARRPLVHVDYRRAPEHPYPAALDDALAVVEALVEQGWAPENVALVGDSAGGGLVLATLLALRDRGGPMPGVAACVCPWTDLTGSGETYRTKEADDPLVTKRVVDIVSRAYLAGTSPTDPYVSPLHGDLSGFPPVLIQVGEREILLSDAERFAAKLAATGSEVALEVWPGMVHVWHLHHPRLAKAREAITRLGDFLRSAG